MYLTQFQNGVDHICSDPNFEQGHAKTQLEDLFKSFKKDIQLIKHKDELQSRAQEIFNHVMGNLDQIAEKHREKNQIKPGKKV